MSFHILQPNAKKLESMNYLYNGLKNAIPDKALKFGDSTRNRSIKAYMNDSFQKSSDMVKAKMTVPEKYGEITVNKLYEKGGFRQADVLLNGTGYALNVREK